MTWGKTLGSFWKYVTFGFTKFALDGGNLTDMQVRYQLQEFFKRQNGLKDLNDSPRLNWSINVVDGNYDLPSYATLKRLADLVPVKHIKYQSEVQDCDDFAWQFRTITKALLPTCPVGYCHVSRRGQLNHALNFCLYRKSSGGLGFAFIEPQTGKVFMTNYKPYLMVV